MLRPVFENEIRVRTLRRGHSCAFTEVRDIVQLHPSIDLSEDRVVTPRTKLNRSIVELATHLDGPLLQQHAHNRIAFVRGDKHPAGLIILQELEPEVSRAGDFRYASFWRFLRRRR